MWGLEKKNEPAVEMEGKKWLGCSVSAPTFVGLWAHQRDTVEVQTSGLEKIAVKSQGCNFESVRPHVPQTGTLGDFGPSVTLRRPFPLFCGSYISYLL